MDLVGNAITTNEDPGACPSQTPPGTSKGLDLQVNSGFFFDSLSLGSFYLTLDHIGVSGCGPTRCRPTSLLRWQSRVGGGVVHVDSHNNDQTLRDLEIIYPTRE